MGGSLIGSQTCIQGFPQNDVRHWYRTDKIGMNRCAAKRHNRTSILGSDRFNRSGRSGIMETPGYASQMHIGFAGGTHHRGGRSGRRQWRHDRTSIPRYESSRRHTGFGRRGRFKTPVFRTATFLRPYREEPRGYTKWVCNISPSGGRNE